MFVIVQLQILNRILSEKSVSILQDNNITKNYFSEYEDEYDFIVTHFENYGVVPDIETVVGKFSDFEPLIVEDSERYLVDTIREEYLYSKSVPIIKKAAELLKTDANEASRYLQSELPSLAPSYTTPAVDIIHNKNRVAVFEDKSLHKDKWLIPTGFEELDDIIEGWQMGEEFVVIFARTGNGKSWVLVKTAQHAWKMGKNVGYISPEMSADKIGYRFDTLNSHMSNRALFRGDTTSITIDEYSKYCDTLSKSENKFLVATPMDFNKQVTVGKLRTFVKENKLDLLAVDGITYMSDERHKNGNNKTTMLTNISEDLMSLSVELKIPILVVVQSNRGGVKEGDNSTPEIENIRDSDGISHNATKIISLRKKEDSLLLDIKKNRDGVAGGQLTYLWDIDKGEFQWIPSDDDTAAVAKKESRREQINAQYKDEGSVVF